MGVYTIKSVISITFINHLVCCMCLRRYVMKTPILNRLAGLSGYDPELRESGMEDGFCPHMYGHLA